MPKDIFEKTELKLHARLAEGKKKDAKVVFSYRRGEALLESRSKDVPAEQTDRVEDDPFEAPLVKEGEDSYDLSCVISVDGDELKRKTWKVWPRFARVEAVGSDGKKFPYFNYTIKQGNWESDRSSTDESGKGRMDLDTPGSFTLLAAPGYTIVSSEASGRRRKVVVDTHFQVEIISPAQGARQYVNLDTASEGQDGFGSLVKVVIGVKGDDQKAPEQRVGRPGVSVYVDVQFGCAPAAKVRSKRDDPAPNFDSSKSDAVLREVSSNGITRLKVELKTLEAGRYVGVLYLELGQAGGDRCEIKAGSTPKCADASIAFENWRKVYYQLAIIDIMKMNGLPKATTDHMEKVGKTIFVEYELDQCVQIAENAAPSCWVQRREFVEKKDGRDKIVVVTRDMDGIFNLAKAPRVACFALGDYVLSRQPDAKLIKYQLKEPATTREAHLPMYPHTWAPADDFSVAWSAVADGVKEVRANLIWQPDGPAKGDCGPDEKVTVTIVNYRYFSDEAPNPTDVKVKFERKSNGQISTHVCDDSKNVLKIELSCTFAHDMLVANDNKVVVQLSGPSSDADDKARLKAVKKLIEEQFKSADPKARIHPGVNADGKPRQGTLTFRDLNMAKSSWREIVVELPAGGPKDPGSFVGKLSATTCPIKLTFEFIPSSTAAGFAFKNIVGGALACAGLSEMQLAGVVLHEIGHKMKMTPYKSSDFAPGLPRSSSFDEKETNYPYIGNMGHYYPDRGNHVGNHCAYGLADKDKKQIDYNKYEKQAKCIMFGLMDQVKDGSTRPEFCPQCVEYIRARDLRTF